MGGYRAAAALGLLILTGCATLTPDGRSTETVDLGPRAAASVAEDLTRVISQRFGPAQTALVLAHSDRPLGQALEQALRRAGYAVRTDARTTGVQVKYVVDRFAPDQVLVRLQMGADFQLARVYATQGEQAVPASAFTLLAQGSPSP